MDLPVGQGKTFGKNVNGLTDKFIGGWGINTIITFQTGFPIIVGGFPGALSSSGINETGCARPRGQRIRTSTCGSKNQKINEWYGTSVFTAGDPTTIGMVPIRAEPNIRCDGKGTSTLPPSKTRSLAR